VGYDTGKECLGRGVVHTSGISLHTVGTLLYNNSEVQDVSLRVSISIDICRRSVQRQRVHLSQQRPFCNSAGIYDIRNSDNGR